MTSTPVSGVLLVDKPIGPTCRKLLDGLERRLEIGALGHAGTLDPLASGLLVVLTGSCRKLQDLFMGGTKTYEGTLRLGWTSETLDGEGPIQATGRTVPVLDPAADATLLAPFLGKIEQVPPAHSAIHVHGRRAHRLARRGETVELKPRSVRIEALEILERGPERLRLRVDCGPGTYIRSLARDLGEALGCGAYLESLRRTRSGIFSVDDARDPDTLELSHLIPISRVLAPFGRIDVDVAAAQRLGQGATITGRVPRDRLLPAFAWHAGEPLCRLKPLPGGKVRSDLKLRSPG